MTKLVLALALAIATLATVPASAGPLLPGRSRVRPDQQLRLRRLSRFARAHPGPATSGRGAYRSTLRERGGATGSAGTTIKMFRAYSAFAQSRKTTLRNSWICNRMQRLLFAGTLRTAGIFHLPVPGVRSAALLDPQGWYGPPSGSCGRQAVLLRAAVCSPTPEATSSTLLLPEQAASSVPNAAITAMRTMGDPLGSSA